MTSCPLRRTLLAAIALVSTFSSAACDRQADAPPASQTAEAATAELGTDTASIYIAPEESHDPPVPTYPDLTRFDWYARGEPLVHDGRSYQPGGPLVAAAPGAMEPLGEYGGVAYYRQSGAGLETLYVPVYGRYWLGFRLRDGAPGS